MRAVVVLSGGVDSACAAALLKHELYGITFAYGQKARSEISAARHLARKLGMKRHRVVDMGFMRQLYGGSNALTSPDMGIPGEFDYSIVVPVRNAVFLSVASAWAFAVGAPLVAYGAHAGDRNYPDCRPAFARKLEAALNSAESDGIRDGERKKIKIWSPYMDGLTKAQLVRAGARRLGASLFRAWSCYADKGRHCGVCESCMNRRRAFEDAGIVDKTRYLR